jgi:hypothetical protein
MWKADAVIQTRGVAPDDSARLKRPAVRRQAAAAARQVEDDAGPADPRHMPRDQVEFAPRAPTFQQPLAVAQVVGGSAFDALVFALVARALLLGLRRAPGLGRAADCQQRNSIAQRIGRAATAAVDGARADRQVRRTGGADQDPGNGLEPGVRCRLWIL